MSSSSDEKTDTVLRSQYEELLQLMHACGIQVSPGMQTLETLTGQSVLFSSSSKDGAIVPLSGSPFDLQDQPAEPRLASEATFPAARSTSTPPTRVTEAGAGKNPFDVEGEFETGLLQGVSPTQGVYSSVVDG